MYFWGQYTTHQQWTILLVDPCIRHTNCVVQVDHYPINVRFQKKKQDLVCAKSLTLTNWLPWKTHFLSIINFLICKYICIYLNMCVLHHTSPSVAPTTRKGVGECHLSPYQTIPGQPDRRILWKILFRTSWSLWRVTLWILLWFCDALFISRYRAQHSQANRARESATAQYFRTHSKNARFHFNDGSYESSFDRLVHICLSCSVPKMTS